MHLNCKTALGVSRHLKKKPIKAKSNGYPTQCSRSRPLDTPCPRGQHFAVFWLAVASRLALAAKLLLQTITKELTLQCATRRGFCEICSFIRSFVHSFCPSSCRDHRSLLKLGKSMNRLSTTIACNVTRGFC